MSEINKHDRSALLEAFKQYLYAEDTSRNTSSAYLSDLSHFLNWCSQTIETFDLDEVTPTDIRDYREHLQEIVPPLAPATINRRLAALRRFFSWAKENGCTEDQPTERIRNVETTDHGPRSLDRKQWHRLQRSVEQAKGNQGIRDRCIVLLLYHTGLRAGELAMLRLSDLTVGERSGHVQVRRGKSNKARCIPLNAEARSAIREYLQIRPSDEGQSLLVGQRGEPLSAHAIYDVVVKYGRKAGLEDVTPHTLRHTFARTLITAGSPLSDVADLLGHSSLDTTRIYTKASETDLAAVVARLEER
ncbi:MAG: tyrosine-type recombinase/integrase [Ktedonobacteraceae bacterium]